MKKREAAAAIRALRKAGISDETIRTEHSELANGWDAVKDEAPATRPQGSGTVGQPLRSATLPL